MRIRTYSAFLSLLLLASPLLADEGDEGLNFVPLFNGKDLDGWVPVNAPKTFSVRDGIIHDTGVPTGYMRTAKRYENFVIELDWMHEKPAGNSGLFLYGAELTAPGTPFTKGIEVQILDEAYVQGEAKEKHLYTGQGDIFSIHGASMKPDRPHPAGWERCLPSEDRTKPAGQWNHYRVEARDGVVKLAVNGKVVSGASEVRPRKGYLALESEGSPAQFKNIRIAELPSTNPKPEECQPEAVGFTSLYTGIDLAGWTGDDGYKDHWKADDWKLRYDGEKQAAESKIRTEKKYGDFELVVDWRFPPKPDNGLAGPSNAPRYGVIQISAPTHLNIPLQIRPGKQADRWNRSIITVKQGHVTIHENDMPARESDLPAGAVAAPIGLLGAAGDSIEFASIFIRELK